MWFLIWFVIHLIDFAATQRAPRLGDVIKTNWCFGEPGRFVYARVKRIPTALEIVKIIRPGSLRWFAYWICRAFARGVMETI